MLGNSIVGFITYWADRLVQQDLQWRSEGTGFTNCFLARWRCLMAEHSCRDDLIYTPHVWLIGWRRFCWAQGQWTIESQISNALEPFFPPFTVAHWAGPVENRWSLQTGLYRREVYSTRTVAVMLRMSGDQSHSTWAQPDFCRVIFLFS